MPDAAFADLRVIDVSQNVAGAYCTKLLADYGADVIKVEPPGEGDAARRLGPFPEDLPHPEKSGLFLHLNTNKRSLSLDVSTTSGAVILKRLLARADVLVESFRPGQMAEWGLGYDDLNAEFPKLIYASITPFGQTGPYRDYRANSLTAMAMSGVMYVTGDPDKEPLATAGEPADYVAGLQCWTGVLAALAYRDREDVGQHVDVSLTEAAASLDEYESSTYAFLGAIRRRYYSRHMFSYPMDVMPCRDGYVCVVPGVGGFPTPLEPERLSAMALLIGDLELDKDPLFLSMRERLTRPDELDALLEPWLTSNDSDEIVELAQQLRMPFAHVPTVPELLESPHLKERGFFVETDQPEGRASGESASGGGRLAQTGAPFRMSETPFEAGRAPTLGEHNLEILTGDLGYDREDLGILRDRGVI